MKTYVTLASLLMFLCFMPGHDRLVHADDGDECLAVPCADPPIKVPVLSCPDPPAPVVTLKVRVPACATPGKNLEYRVFVENKSPAPAHNVVVRDLLPANARFVSASPKPHVTQPELKWLLGTIQGHACQEITLVLAPKDRGDITNCLRVQFEHGVCLTTRIAGSSPEAIPVPPTLEPTKKDPEKKKDPIKEPKKSKLTLSVNGPRQQGIGEPARFKLVVANEGPGQLRNIKVDTVIDTPEQRGKLIFVDASEKGVHLEGKVSWYIELLEPGTSRTLELTLKAKEKGKWCTKSHALADGGIATANEEWCTNFVGVSDVSALLLEMYDREDPINVGATTSYYIYALNQGHAPVTNLRMQATLPPGMEFVRVGGPDFKRQGKIITFDPIKSLAPGAKVEYEVFASAVAPGEQRFKIEMNADQLKEGGPVHEEESTMVYDENAPAVRAQISSRQKTRRLIALQP